MFSKRKLVIEASHISFGGGYTLLAELLKQLNKRSIPIDVYISRKAVINELEKEKNNYANIIKTNTVRTIIRYAKRRRNVIYFANLPPFVRNIKSVVYFHNELILEERQFRVKKLKLFIYYYWVKFFINKTDAVVCQTDNILNKLNQIRAKSVIKLPFYEEFKPDAAVKKKYTFCYVCSGAPHKNVQGLFNSIEQMVKKIDFSLVVTIEKSATNNTLLNQINAINRNAGKEIIINRGLVSKNEVLNIYQSSEALVFPSLNESLGLPLIEANMCGIKVLSSDLPFSYEVLNSPIVFNPYDCKAIAKTLNSFINGEFDDINQSLKVKNKIEELINLVT